jgi:hypothetical protein
MEVSDQFHAPAALLPRKRPRYPFHRTLDRLQSRSGRGGEEKKSLTLPGLEPSSFAILTELPWPVTGSGRKRQIVASKRK